MNLFQAWKNNLETSEIILNLIHSLRHADKVKIQADPGIKRKDTLGWVATPNLKAVLHEVPAYCESTPDSLYVRLSVVVPRRISQKVIVPRRPSQ